jgi:hypothetical protein
MMIDYFLNYENILKNRWEDRKKALNLLKLCIKKIINKKQSTIN